MQVFVDNTLIDMRNQAVIGSGGEGVVVKTQLLGRSPTALKVYHQPTRQRSEKLEQFLAHRWSLPNSKVAIPQKPVYNKGHTLIVGFVMPYLGTNIEDIASLANKKSRTSLGTNTKTIAQIFLDGHYTLEQIHANGLVVGDLSDLNVLFRNTEMLWIDADAWQFDIYPCPVATMEFVDPRLYGIDLSKGPMFQPENDWYSYAVLLFRSLLFVHPYGGTHKRYKSLIKRAQNRITVLDSGVKYPKMALSPDILSDDLAHKFMQVFKDGERGIFPRDTLENYLRTLISCPHCDTWYPQNRFGCPVCNKRSLLVISKPTIETRDVRITQLFRTQGNIVYSKVVGNNVHIIVQERGQTILYTLNKNGHSTKQQLPTAAKGDRYALTENLLAINPVDSQSLVLYDISSGYPRALQQSVTEIFAPSRKAAFQASATNIIRIVGGNIMAAEKRDSHIIERYVRNGIPNQTWFSANGTSETLQLFGFVQILQERKYWYHIDGQNYEPSVPKLKRDESLTDISVEFSKDGVLLRRKTQHKGVYYLRIEEIDNKGRVTCSLKSKLEDHPVQSLHGQTYSGGVLLYASDNGIVQEKVASQRFKTFKQTERFVKEGDTLYKFNRGVVVISSNTVTYLELTQS